MREISFKGKTKDTDKWIYGDLLQYADTAQIWVQTDEGKWNYIVYPETVCQYTGLTDKNGRKIFEGDIVGLYSNYRKEWDYGVVKYGDFNCSCCEGVYGWYFEDGDIRRYDEYEVKGNIYDNPELIGDQP